MNVGIVGYGAYIPKWRIKVEEIAKAWNQDVEKIKSSLLIQEKSVPNNDQDSATLGVHAAQNALLRAQITSTLLNAIYVGSESHPYAVKPTATIIAQALGTTTNYFAADLEFACKAGTAALQICYALAKAGLIKYGLAIGSDTAQSKPGDILEYSASAGAAAFIIGNKTEEIIATIDHTLSFSSDTPDFWRRGLQKYPSHAGRFTGEPSYFKHVLNATQNILKQTKLKAQDFDYVIFHQPNGKFPLSAAQKLGFTKEQILPGLLITQIGNTYSASSPLSLTAILDIAKPDQKILMTSYGSGSGSDSFVLTTTNNITKKQNLAKTTLDYVNQKDYVDYLTYKKLTEITL